MPELLDPSDWVERLSKIHLRGGVVGKITTALMVVCVGMSAIACAVRIWWVALVALGLIFLLCFPLLWRLVTFAERNPYAALFEGAELLAHEKLKLGTKAVPELPSSSPPQSPPTQPALTEGGESSETHS
jgi:hypothetical protein